MTAKASVLNVMENGREGMDEKRWWLVEEALARSGQWIEEELNASSREEAIAQAQAAWNRLTPNEQKATEAFYVGFAAKDEEGCVDFDTMTDIFEIKSRNAR